MTITRTQKIILALIIVGVLSYAGYTYFAPAASVTSNLFASATTSADTTQQDILILVNKLNNISIDQSIFSSPLFTSLRDSSAVLTPEQQGRPNPFAQIGIGSSFVVDPVSYSPSTTTTPPVIKINSVKAAAVKNKK